MSQQPKQNMGQSVLDRLKAKSIASGEVLDFLLNRYVVERLLYRLSISPYTSQFVLKGGTLFLAWNGEGYRVTRDLDLRGSGSADVDEMVRVFKDICSTEVEFDDGVNFLSNSLKGAEIREVAQYSGIRIHVGAAIHTAQVSLQIDIGFGDIITPAAETLDYPTLLNMPNPRIRAYPKYTVIAEKFEAMVSLGIRNSRMKDFYDVWLMRRLFDFDGSILMQAIKNTFERRGTPLPEQVPFAFTEEFYADRSKQAQWKGFAKPSVEMFGENLNLEQVIKEIAHFLTPVLEAIREDKPFHHSWSIQSGWTNSPIE